MPSPKERLEELAALAGSCTACDLYRDATQTVFGEGPVPAPLMLVGEQPGDKEDRAGHPFVGPAGGLLHRAGADAGLDLTDAYVTNAVKHFKWERSGKVRLHKPPNVGEIKACRPWWESELDLVDPAVVCCLGATAARTVLGPAVKVTRDRGRWFGLADRATDVVVTVHPSSVLRAREGERERQYDAFVRDLVAVAERLTATH